MRSESLLVVDTVDEIVPWIHRIEGVRMLAETNDGAPVYRLRDG